MTIPALIVRDALNMLSTGASLQGVPEIQTLAQASQLDASFSPLAGIGSEPSESTREGPIKMFDITMDVWTSRATSVGFRVLGAPFVEMSYGIFYLDATWRMVFRQVGKTQLKLFLMPLIKFRGNVEWEAAKFSAIETVLFAAVTATPKAEAWAVMIAPQT